MRLWPWTGGGVCAKTRSEVGDGTAGGGRLFAAGAPGKPARPVAVVCDAFTVRRNGEARNFTYYVKCVLWDGEN